MRKRRRRNPKQTEQVKEEGKKKKKSRTYWTNERRRRRLKKKKEKKRKKNRTANPGEERKKKSQKVVKSCGWVLFMGPLCVFNYNIVIKLWVMETENSQNVFLVSITHNSKIKELSDGNRVLDFPNNLFAMGLTIFELWVMETENWVTKTGHPNNPLMFH